ncbi:hypothetical protein NAH03_21070, partial [Stenotrophomonas maltophilia]|uniref:hypothetical protein n=1 Tax=Stenotrophomonas maltophilia TaxID=40324 RepID=UPI00224D1325|nr:hypothetical protein [Stenotrophomonas maltophilia]
MSAFRISAFETADITLDFVMGFFIAVMAFWLVGFVIAAAQRAGNIRNIVIVSSPGYHLPAPLTK